METLDTNSGEQLSMSPLSKQVLIEASKWANFLAIVGFVMLGFMVIGALFFIVAGSSLPMGVGFPSAFIGVLYLAMAGLYFFPTYYLFQFAAKIKSCIQINSQEEMEQAFINLKSMFKFVGILTIIVISLYIVVFLIAFLAAASL